MFALDRRRLKSRNKAWPEAAKLRKNFGRKAPYPPHFFNPKTANF
jgi:hypothetical protein